MKTEFQGGPVAGGTFPAGDLEDVHGVAAEDRPAAQGPRAATAPASRRADARHGHDDRAAATATPCPPTATAPPSTGSDGRADAGAHGRADGRPRARRPHRRADHHAAATRRRHRPGAGADGSGRLTPRSGDADAVTPGSRRPGPCQDRCATEPTPAEPAPRRPQRAARSAAPGEQAGRPGPRHAAAAAGRAEAPGQLGRLGDADRAGRSTYSTARLAGAAGSGPGRRQRRAVLARARSPAPGSACPGRCTGRARARPRRARISSQSRERLERADQHRRAHALRLADRVQQRVDAVGAVDVGGPGRPEAARGCAASRRRRRGRPARSSGRPRSRRSRPRARRGRRRSRAGRGATSSTGRS